MTKKGTAEYYWNGQEHLTKVVKDGTATQYRYDLLGRRVAKKVDSGAWNWYFYDGLKVIAEGTSATNRIYYMNGPSELSGLLSDGTRWFHYDRLGNVVATVDGDGLPSEFVTLNAFGNIHGGSSAAARLTVFGRWP